VNLLLDQGLPRLAVPELRRFGFDVNVDPSEVSRFIAVLQRRPRAGRRLRDPC
jgi:hypothetical protein